MFRLFFDAAKEPNWFFYWNTHLAMLVLLEDAGKNIKKILGIRCPAICFVSGFQMGEVGITMHSKQGGALSTVTGDVREGLYN
jgi:hypothetical protein